MELIFRRTHVHSLHDVRRLEEGEDLNDALLDFFVKLGQALIPASTCGLGKKGDSPPSCGVAYLGSLFYDMLHVGGVEDGRAGHANVANWAKRRLGKGGVFVDSIGALAVPINETLQDAGKKEKHWWLAMILNPRGGGMARTGEGLSMLCLDSFARADLACSPPLCAKRVGSETQVVEASVFSRIGFSAQMRFRCEGGEGEAEPLPDPRKSLVSTGNAIFKVRSWSFATEQSGGDGKPGLIEGSVDFHLNSVAKTSGDFLVDFAGDGVYTPVIKFRLERSRSQFQSEVARFLGGYFGKEWETNSPGVASGEGYEETKLADGLQLPDVPQQEKANDCGFFVLEQILRTMQLAPEALRALARASVEEVAKLPWPTQQEVADRKAKLRETLDDLIAAAALEGTGDVEVLIKKDADLRRRVQAAMFDGPGFADSVAAWIGKPPEFTPASLGTMTTKQLRALCIQLGVLSSSMVDREDLLQALKPLAKVEEKPQAPKPAPPAANMNGHATAGAAPQMPSAPVAAAKPAMLRPPPDVLKGEPFTKADLQVLPVKILRTLCVQKKVMPSGTIEKSHLVEALMPYATFPPPRADFLGGASFTMEDLDNLPMRSLRSLCMQRGVLPSGEPGIARLKSALQPFSVTEDQLPDAKRRRL